MYGEDINRPNASFACWDGVLLAADTRAATSSHSQVPLTNSGNRKTLVGHSDEASETETPPAPAPSETAASPRQAARDCSKVGSRGENPQARNTKAKGLLALEALTPCVRKAVTPAIEALLNV